MDRALKKAAVLTGVVSAGLFAFYRWQPQRYQFRSKNAPQDDPAVDPATEFLFSPDSSVAVVTAHPDDAEFYIGGTLTRLYEAGARIALIVTTDGDKGYYPGADAESNRRVRRLEQIESARAFGCEDVTFLAYPDGRLRNSRELVRRIRDAVIQSEAQFVLSFDPVYPPKVQHSDHLRTGAAVVRALKEVPNVEFLLQFSTQAPNFAVDITDVWPHKARLLAFHKSQFQGRKLRMIEQLVKGKAASDGELAGVPLAEGFRVIQRDS